MSMDCPNCLTDMDADKNTYERESDKKELWWSTHYLCEECGYEMEQFHFGRKIIYYDPWAWVTLDEEAKRLEEEKPNQVSTLAIRSFYIV